MSWDIMMIRTKDNAEEMEDLKEENVIFFSVNEITEELGRIAIKTGAMHDCCDVSWQVLKSAQWSIEFNVGKRSETSMDMYLVLGMLFLVLGIVLIKYFSMSDFANGCLYGASAGILILGILVEKKYICKFKK